MLLYHNGRNTTDLRLRRGLNITLFFSHMLQSSRQAGEVAAYRGRKGCMDRPSSCKPAARGMWRQGRGRMLCYDLFYRLHHWSTAAACMCVLLHHHDLHELICFHEFARQSVCTCWSANLCMWVFTMCYGVHQSCVIWLTYFAGTYWYGRTNDKLRTRLHMSCRHGSRWSFLCIVQDCELT